MWTCGNSHAYSFDILSCGDDLDWILHNVYNLRYDHEFLMLSMLWSIYIHAAYRGLDHVTVEENLPPTLITLEK